MEKFNSSMVKLEEESPAAAPEGQTILGVAEVLTTQRGKDKLSFEGYIYHRDSIRDSKSYWRCENQNCKGRAAALQKDNVYTMISVRRHNHPPDASRKHLIKALNEFTHRTRTTSDPPSKIIKDITVDLPPEARLCLPSISALTSKAGRIRRSLQSMPMPSDEDLLIKCEGDHSMNSSYTNTLAGEQFLLKDTVTSLERKAHLRFFTTTENLRHLSQAQAILLLNSSCTPNEQLCCILAAVGSEYDGEAAPLLFILMNNQTQPIHETLFQALIDLMDENEVIFKPANIMTNFPAEVMQMLRKLFPESKICCSFFHLWQNIWIQIQQQNLETHYAQDISFNLRMREFAALAFLAPEKIPEAYELLVPSLPSEAKGICDWWEANYIYENNSMEKESHYIPSDWCISRDILQESLWWLSGARDWHRKSEVILQKVKSNIFALINELQKEQAKTEALFIKKMNHEPKRQRTKKSQILQLYEKRDCMHVMEYLCIVAHNLDLNS